MWAAGWRLGSIHSLDQHLTVVSTINMLTLTSHFCCCFPWTMPPLTESMPTVHTRLLMHVNHYLHFLYICLSSICSFSNMSYSWLNNMKDSDLKYEAASHIASSIHLGCIAIKINSTSPHWSLPSVSHQCSFFQIQTYWSILILYHISVLMAA